MKEGLFHFVYFTFLHNSEAIGYTLAALAALVCLLKRPTRQRVLFFLGFLVLLVHFEYQKHLVQNLAEQTVSTIFIEEGNYRARWLTNTTLYHLIPLLMWLVGWGSVIWGLLGGQFPSRPKRSPRHHELN